MPELYIITGSNGAGKSTIGQTFLPSQLKEGYPVFDGDKLFMQKQKELWLSGMRAHKEARKIAYEHVTDTFDRLVDEALAKNENFIYEGHFTNDATWDIPKRFMERGYKLGLIFLGLANPDLSELRVLGRVKMGGHFVDRRTVEDNFYGNLEKLDKYYAMIDDLQIIDTSESEHLLIATLSKGKALFCIPQKAIPGWFAKHLPGIYNSVVKSA